MKLLRKYRLKVGFPEQRYVTDVDGVIVPSNAAIIEDLHIEFDVVKSDDSSKTLNSASIRIYNLTDQTKSLIERPDSVVILEAGWEDDSFGLIFQGDVVTYKHMRQGTDWVTTLTCADGYYGVREAITHKTYPAGSSVLAVLLDLIKGQQGDEVYYSAQGRTSTRPPIGLGLAIGEMKGLGLFETFDNSYSIAKPTKQAIDDICYAHHLKWSIQDGKVYVSDDRGDPDRKFSVPLISETTGLIESPEIIYEGTGKRKNDRTPVSGYKFTCTLNHEIIPEIFVKIVSDEITALAKVKKVKHKGSFEGSSWETEVEAIIQDNE
jgi:hypothetical protein